MLRLSTLLGHVCDPEIAPRLAHVADHGGVETVLLSGTDITRKRLLARTDRGTEVALMLDRDAVLVDGSVLLLTHDRAVVVRLDEAVWMAVRAADAAQALELGYFAGSLHWKVRFDGTLLLVAQEMARENYLARLQPLLARDAITLEPDVRSSQPAVTPPPHVHRRGHEDEPRAGHAHDHGLGHVRTHEPGAALAHAHAGHHACDHDHGERDVSGRLS
jgi:urease accessory protein